LSLTLPDVTPVTPRWVSDISHLTQVKKISPETLGLGGNVQ
jgi:hypothetical protein